MPDPDTMLRDVFGFLAARQVVSSFASHSIGRMRPLALLSNPAFVHYALTAGLIPILAAADHLHLFELSRTESRQAAGPSALCDAAGAPPAPPRQTGRGKAAMPKQIGAPVGAPHG